jgi:Protein of unknown function (DUF2933)
MNTVFFLALLLICPAVMMLMMRGMRGEGQAAHGATPASVAGDGDRPIADMEREVTTLRAQRDEPLQMIDRRREDRR